MIEDVHQLGAPCLAPQPQGIEKVPRRVALRLDQRPRQNHVHGIDRLGPPAPEGPRRPAVGPLAGQLADRRREPHLELEPAAFKPVVQAMGVAVHRRPALEREVGN